MNSCEVMKELLVGLIYEDLGPEDRQRVEEHLRGCDRCRREREALERVVRVLAEQAPPVPDISPGRITVLPARVPRAPLWAAAASLFLAALLAVFALGEATLSAGREGFSLSFARGGAEEEMILEAMRREAQETALAAVDRRLAQQRSPEILFEEVDRNLALWEQGFTRRLDDRRSRWEAQQREDLHRVLAQGEELQRDAARTRSLLEYTLLASKAPRLVEQ
jgi:anti-sigma factor RsiW